MKRALVIAACLALAYGFAGCAFHELAPIPGGGATLSGHAVPAPHPHHQAYQALRAPSPHRHIGSPMVLWIVQVDAGGGCDRRHADLDAVHICCDTAQRLQLLDVLRV